MKRIPLYFCLGLLGLTLIGSAFAAYRNAERLTINEPVGEDFYAAGERVEVQAPLEGDLVVAGRIIDIMAPVAMDLIAAGDQIRLDAAVGDDVRLAGRSLRINNDVIGHLVAAGEDIHLSENSRVGEWAWLAGRTIRIEGQIGREVRIAGQNVTISGQIEGDVEVHGQSLELTSGARIEGNLTVLSDNPPTVAEDASISGEIIHRPVEPKELPGWLGAVGWVYSIVLMIVTVVVVYLIFPGFSANAADKVRGSPLKSLGLGVLVLVATPPVILLLFLVGVGALLGGALLLTYLLWLLLGYIIACVFLASLGLRGLGKGQDASLMISVLAVLAAVVIVQLLPLIPYVGKLAVLVLFLFGLGGSIQQLLRNYHRLE